MGTCSGKPFFRSDRNLAMTTPCTFPIDGGIGFVSEKCGDENSVGMIKFYRTRCFKQIGGFVRMLMWDGIDCHRCRMLGWIAASWDEPGIRFEHLRPMGTSHKNWWTGRVRHGVGQWYMGTSLDYMLVSARISDDPPATDRRWACDVVGVRSQRLTRQPRYEDLEFRKFLRSYQRACLFKGKTRATHELNQRQADAWTVHAAAV